MGKNLLVILIFVIFGIKSLFAQCTPCNDPAPVGIIDYNSARIVMLSGGNVNFNFNSIDDFKNGITLSNQTILGIHFCDCNSEFGADPVAGSSISGWDLYFDTDDANIAGQNPANTLPLCMLEAEATPRTFSMADPTITYNGRQPLNTQGAGGMTPVVEETTVLPATPSRTWNNDQIFITYYFAVPPTNATCIGAGQNFPIIDDPVDADYYTVTASFTLVPRCVSCADPFY